MDRNGSGKKRKQKRKSAAPPRELVREAKRYEGPVAGTVFTTHTPVPAGIDRFPRDLVEKYFTESPAMPLARILELGDEGTEAVEGIVKLLPLAKRKRFVDELGKVRSSKA